MNTEVYLDNSATTAVFPEVVERMNDLMLREYGNPSSMHLKGVKAEGYIKEAKLTLAGILKVSEKELLFTSGGTESDNMALMGCAAANNRRGRHIITSQIEHPAILQTCKHLEEQGYRITYLPVDKSGRISLEDLASAMTPETILVSIMHTNNEVGSLQPIAEAGALIKRMNPTTLFHVDAVQGFGKAKIYPKKMNVDLMSVSSHKIHGPKGVGFLYIAERTKIMPIIYGGGQQLGLRSGTENVPGVSGMAKAAQMLYEHLDEELEKLYDLKKRLIVGLEQLPEVRVNGLLPDAPYGEGTAPHIVSASFLGVRSEVLLHALEDKGIYVSAGSACSSHKPQPSATLRAMKVDPRQLECTIRFSFSIHTTIEEIDYTLQALYDTVPMLRKYTRRA